MKNFVKTRIVSLFEAMRSIAIIAVVATIGFSMVACSDDDGGGGYITVNSTNGKITISGFPAEYNGKWVTGGNENSDVFLFAAQNVDSRGTMTGGQIVNSSVTLNVWSINYDGDYYEDEDGIYYDHTTLDNYAGNDTTSFYVDIWDRQTITESNSYSAWLGEGGVGSLTFVNGIGYGTILGIYTDFD